ncbi:MAG: hypothetical protein WA820_26585 [Bradyrhizobium sp.]
MAQEPRYSSHDGAYEPRYASYDDQYAEPVDLDEFGSQLRSYHPSRSIVTREEFLPDDSVPLFLSGSDEDSAQRFGRLRRNRSRLLKTGILAIAASAAAFTVVAVKNPFTVFANATASLIGISDVRSAPATTTAAVQPIVGTRTVPPTSSQSPSRDEIAVALRTAHQNVAPAETAAPLAAVAPVVAAAPPAAPAAAAPAAVAPPAAMAPPVAAAAQVVATASPVAAPPPAVAAPPVVAAPAARKISPDELATLMSRARTLLAAGDLPSARLLLERAAEGQDANAALLLARTYDPLIMGTQDTRNTLTDPELARTWYQRAAQLGSADAQRRLSQLQ